MRSGLSVLLGLAVLGAAASAWANTILIKFDGTDGVCSSIWYEDSRGASNTGAESPVATYLSVPGGANMKYDQALYRPVLPANFAGATINSATFTVADTWWNMGMTTNLSRINTAATWDPGNGTHGGRWTFPDNGIQQWWADWDQPTTSGVRWDGTIAPTGSSYNSPSNPTFAATCIGTLIDTQRINAGGQAVFNILSLAQHWANGTWDNDGFVLTGTTDATGDSTLKLSTSGTNRGLFIDYTPVPEPAVIGTVTAGSLVMLRRRRRTA